MTVCILVTFLITNQKARRRRNAIALVIDYRRANAEQSRSVPSARVSVLPEQAMEFSSQLVNLRAVLNSHGSTLVQPLAEITASER